MKRILFLLPLTLMLASCEADFIGQYPVDDIPPAKVSNAVVENLPGKVKISYSLPNDTDLLYIKASYIDSHGKKQEVRASNFKNSIEIKGFAKSASQNIDLISVDRSQNESEPVRVVIEPLDAPIYSILESLEVSPSWGGMKLSWDNPENEQIFMYVSMAGEDGEDEIVQTIISTEANGASAVRGLDAVETSFKIVIRDIYENYTEEYVTTLTPLYEKFIEPDKFILMALATDMNWHKSRNNAGALFDGVKTSDKPIYMETKAKYDGLPYSYFTVDLGNTYKLSRIKFWGRLPNYAFSLHSPRHFQIWGTADPDAAADPNNWTGWELIMDDWSHKPSGDGPDVTAEDKDYAIAGEEYEVPEEANGLRYCRFVCLETWTKSANLNMNEMEFYGAELNIL